MPGIYLRQETEFIPMREMPYQAEDLLQKLVADHPEMLAGDDAEGSRRWLLIERETSVAEEEDRGGRWSLDHLFVDPTAYQRWSRSSGERIRALAATSWRRCSTTPPMLGLWPAGAR